MDDWQFWLLMITLWFLIVATVDAKEGRILFVSILGLGTTIGVGAMYFVIAFAVGW